MNRKSTSLFRPYRVSIIVAGSVGLGFWTGYVDGAGIDAVLRSALIVSSVMIVFFAAYGRCRIRRTKRTRKIASRHNAPDFRFSIWAASCIAIGLAIAHADGVGTRGLVGGGLMMSCVICVVIVIKFVCHRLRRKTPPNA